MIFKWSFLNFKKAYFWLDLYHYSYLYRSRKNTNSCALTISFKRHNDSQNRTFLQAIEDKKDMQGIEFFLNTSPPFLGI